MTDMDYKEAEDKLRELAASGMSRPAEWAVKEIDRLRKRTEHDPLWAVWLPDQKVASFDATRFMYSVLEDGDLVILDTNTTTEGTNTTTEDEIPEEVSRFAGGQWCGVVRTDVLAATTTLRRGLDGKEKHR